MKPPEGFQSNFMGRFGNSVSDDLYHIKYYFYFFKTRIEVFLWIDWKFQSEPDMLEYFHNCVRRVRTVVVKSHIGLDSLSELFGDSLLSEVNITVDAKAGEEGYMMNYISYRGRPTK